MTVRLRGLATGCAVLILLSALGADRAFAQATAQISGSVRDDSGGVLPGVDVTVTQTNTGLTRNTVTDAGGNYVLTNLPLGPYRLDVTLAGFRPYQQTGIVLQVGSSPTVNVTLGLGALTETVSVEAAAPLVDTQRAGIGEVIENERIEQLPLNGRNPTDLIVLTGAAVQTDEASTRSVQGSSGGRGIAVAGGQSSGTAYILDGAMHNNPYDNLNLPLPFPDALQEFRVETGALGAGSGVHSGASVNAVTRSGTNAFRGDLFEFWRNHRFNATSPFASVRDGERQGDGLNRNQFGGTLGGPVVRDRMFFFGGYQGTIIDQTPTDNISFVPTAAMLSGDFSAAVAAGCTGGSLRGPAAGNRVDPSAFSPAALEIASRLPTSTDPCGRVAYGTARNTDEGQGIGRIDYQLSTNNLLFGRYMATSYNTPPALALSDNLLTSNVGGFDNMAQSLTLGNTWVLGSNAVNALRFAWNNTDIHRIHHGHFRANDVGIDAYSYLEDYFILSVTGGFNIGSGVQNEARFKTRTLQIADDVTLVRGDHQFAFGVNVAQWDSFSQAHVRSSGQFGVNGRVTGYGLADFLLGNASSYIQSAPNTLDMYQWYVGFYGADTWRAGPRLTLNYGLRWEPYLPQQIANGYVYNFSLERFRRGTKSEVFPNAPAGFVYPGDDEFVGGKSGMNTKWTNFAPRVSAAWDATGDGRTSIRAGYSLGYDFVNGQYHLNTSNAPPWGAEVRLSDVSLDAPFSEFPGGNPFPRTFDESAPFNAFGSFLVVDPDTENTRQHSWNVAVQRQIGDSFAVSATYLGNRTQNLWHMRALNPGVPEAGQTRFLDTRRLLYLENPEEGRFIGHLDMHDASGRQRYHGLLLSAQRRSTDNVSASINYTLSTCEGHPTTSLPNVGTGWADPDNPDYDYGPCGSDRRHMVNATVGYTTPQIDGALGVLASDWSVNGILRARSGAPLSVWTGQDRALTGVGAGNNGNQRADQVLADGYGDKTVDNWLNRAAFAQPAFGTLGDSERGGFRGPGRWTIDMVLARLIRLNDAHRIELRAEAFNLTNNFIKEDPITNLSNANFGRILEAGDPRILQFAVKYSF